MLALFLMGFLGTFHKIHGGSVKTTPMLKFEPKVLETWNFARSIPFIFRIKKYLNVMQQTDFLLTSAFSGQNLQILSKSEHFQIAISRQQIKVKRTLTPH